VLSSSTFHLYTKIEEKEVGICLKAIQYEVATTQLNPPGAVLGYELTEIAAMKSHLNRLARIQADTLKDQVAIDSLLKLLRVHSAYIHHETFSS